MCFSNFHNRFGSMQIFLNFGVYSDGQENIEKQKEEDMKEINSTLSTIWVSDCCIEDNAFYSC